MEFRTVDLDGQNLADMLAWSDGIDHRKVGCKFCLYWEEPDRNNWPELPEEQEHAKGEWFRRVQRDWGTCGKLAYVDEELAGYCQFAPAEYLPNVGEYECGPPGDDSVFVSCLFVRCHTRSKVGSRLLDAVLADLSSRGVRAAETFARKGNPENPSGPIEFWLANGFIAVREDNEFALMRRELR